MKITLIAGYYSPEQCADTRLNKDFATSLSDRGYKVTVIVPFPTRNVSPEVQEDYCNKRCEIVSENLKIIRVGNPNRYKDGLIQRGWSFLKKSFVLYKEAKKIPTDIFFIVSTPPFLGYVASLLSKNTLVVYKLEDIFPDSLLYVKNYSELNLLIIFLRKLEKWIYRSVSLIVTESANMKYTLVERGVNQDRIAVIPDWIDETSCFPVERGENRLFDKWNLDRNKFYVCYAGNIGLLQNVLTMVNAAKIIAKKYPEIQFVVIGDGACKKELEIKIAEEELYNFYVFPMQQESIIAYVYSLGDVGIVSVKPGVINIALPSKTWAVLAAGRAVICEIDKPSELSRLIDDEHCGYSVSPGNSLEMATRIIELYNNQSLAKEMGGNGRRFILNNLTKELAMKQYEKIIDRMQSMYKGENDV